VWVQVAARDGRTVVRIQETLELQGFRKAAIPAGIIIGGGMGAAWTGLVGMGEPLAPLLTVGMAALAAFLGVRLVIDSDANHRRPQLRELARVLAELANATPEPAAPPPALPS
jgi:hypothetical protein